MKNHQTNLFGSKRLEFTELMDLTIQSMNAYGPLYKHWAIAWSFGKDSTTLLTVIIQLIRSGQIAPPETITVLCADTRLELLPLWMSAKALMKKLEEEGIIVKIVQAPVEDRFLTYILGRGVPPPSNTFRWCTSQIKIEPMNAALEELRQNTNEKFLMLTGVRQGESAVRDERIMMSCSKDGAECGQGWYQTGKYGDVCSTLAPILHWRVCVVWDWLKIFAPSSKFGSWPTQLLADAYGGDEAEEINARTGCVACPLASKDKALQYVVKQEYWSYLSPLQRLKSIYREMRKPQYRLRKNGELKKDGTMGKNQQRLGPITIEARKDFFNQILAIQNEINIEAVKQNKPLLDLINEEEETFIISAWESGLHPDRWNGDEITGDILLDKIYSDGTIQPILFREMVGKSNAQ
jgi:DNA sulfur modification protein DndC